MLCAKLFFLSCVRFVKFSMPSIPDFETLFSQVQLFISTCNGEHIRYATDTCKLIQQYIKYIDIVWYYWFFFFLLNSFVCLFVCFLCLVAGLCHQLTNALVERKQVSKYHLVQIRNLRSQALKGDITCFIKIYCSLHAKYFCVAPYVC